MRLRNVTSIDLAPFYYPVSLEETWLVCGYISKHNLPTPAAWIPANTARSR